MLSGKIKFLSVVSITDFFAALIFIYKTGSNGAFLTGAYCDPSYKAHMVFVTASFRF